MTITTNNGETLATVSTTTAALVEMLRVALYALPLESDEPSELLAAVCNARDLCAIAADAAHDAFLVRGKGRGDRDVRDVLAAVRHGMQRAHVEARNAWHAGKLFADKACPSVERNWHVTRARTVDAVRDALSLLPTRDA